LVFWGLFDFVLTSYFLIIRPNSPIETLNKYGWMKHPVDPVAEEFLKYSKNKPHPTLLEVGAGTGSISLLTLKNGAYIWINELDMRNLGNFSEKVPAEYSKNYQIVIGNFNDNLNLPHNYFDGILADRVVHFFDPSTLRSSIAKMHRLLKTKGRVFILACSPYGEAFKSFFPEYLKRKERGDLFPGYIENISKYNFPAGVNIQQQFHLFDPDVLRREFEQAGFVVSFCQFVKEGFEERRMVGLIAEKTLPFSP